MLGWFVEISVVRNTRAAQKPDLRDVFLCHAWDDRQGIAKQLHDLLEPNIHDLTKSLNSRLTT